MIIADIHLTESGNEDNLTNFFILVCFSNPQKKCLTDRCRDVNGNQAKTDPGFAKFINDEDFKKLNQ